MIILRFEPRLRRILSVACAFFVAALCPGAIGARAPIVQNAADLQRIEEAAPTAPLVPPQRARRLLLFCLNVGYGGHASIDYANEAFQRMGEKTGAFEAVVSRDPEMFRKERLSQFDAVFFNNTVGNCFTNAELRQNLVEFVYGGGGLLGVHGTTVAFTRWPGAIEDWPEFGLMIGARGANHRESTEHAVIKVEQPDHPLVRCFGSGRFEYRDEFFRVHDPYSRQRLRVLLSLDLERTTPEEGRGFGQLVRADHDYALAWIQNYGRGRVFYSTIAHNPYVFWDRTMLQFYLGAIQFALGDLAAPTTPSARLSPATLAQERLGWRLGVEAYTFHKFTLFEAIEKTAELGLPYMGGLSFQKVSADIPKNFDPDLSDNELARVRQKLAAAGVRLLTYYVQQIPGDEPGCRRWFDFGRRIGIETFMTEPSLDALDTIEKFCDRYDIRVALHNHDQKSSPAYWSPEAILNATSGRSPRMGACADIGYWLRSGIDPVEGIRKLNRRLITLQLHDLNERSPDGHDVPWGTGTGRSEKLLRELHRLGVQPTMVGLEYSHHWLESLPEIAQCVRFFNELSLKLTQ